MIGWLSFIFTILEKPWIVLLIGLGFSGFVSYWRSYSVLRFLLLTVGFPLGSFLAFVGGLIIGSWMHDGGAPTADMNEYISFKDKSLQAKYSTQKMPIGDLYELYMKEQLDFKKDVYETLLMRHKLFRFCFTLDQIKFYVLTFVGTNLNHSVSADHGDIAHVYNRGNDFYNWFLGESMIYTSGIFRSRDESLEDGQRRKMDLVCKQLQMKKGDKHLDIGCGWGTLLAHSAEHYGADVTGVTLAKEQAAFGKQRAKDHKVSDRVNILTMDYREIPKDLKFDKISCLEMAEHVGIKNFQPFLRQVRNMLKDDGLFYLQIAGLRRAWQWEDLVWGLFMGKYIFPGADASCPLGFDVVELERAGFEVHRVENTGTHYSLTIKKWYDNWKKNEKPVVAKYGQWWFRMWMIFLSWSAIIAAQGSSTVFMITCNKNLKNDKDSVSEAEAAKQPISRMGMWVGKDPIETQQ